MRRGASIGEWAIIGAGAVVLADVEAHRVVVGNPARALAWAGRCGHVVSDERWGIEDTLPTCGQPLR